MGWGVGLYTLPKRVVVKVDPESLGVPNKLIIRSLILSCLVELARAASYRGIFNFHHPDVFQQVQSAKTVSKVKSCRQRMFGRRILIFTQRSEEGHK